MKKFTRIAAVLMAVIMLVCISALSVSAAGTGTITITNAYEDQIYTLYKIADLESSSGDSYSYKIADPKWEAFLESYSITVTDEGYILYADNLVSRIQPEFAKAAVAYAIANDIAPVATETATSGTLAFTGLDLGYYVIDSTLGTVCTLTNANPNASVIDKNNEPVITKYVKENSTGTYDRANDDYIGATVEYLVEIVVGSGATNYIVSDQMSAGLTFNPASVDVFYGTDIDSHIEIGYTLLVPDADGDGTVDATFEAEMDALYGNDDWRETTDDRTYWEGRTFILFLDNNNVDGVNPTAGVESLVDNTVIQVTYTATINEDALINAANTNEVELWYGNDPRTVTEKSIVKTYVWDFGVLKFASHDGVHVPLAGATFVIYDATNSAANPFYLRSLGTNGDGIPVYELIKNQTVETDPITGDHYVVIEGMNVPVFTEIVTSTDGTAGGRFIIQGLDSGTFYLHETAAPAGYNPLSFDITVVVSHTGTYSSELGHYVLNTNNDGFIEVQNYTGVVLPETGAEGTIIFTTVGGLLVLVMGVQLFIRKRMSQVVFTK